MHTMLSIFSLDANLRPTVLMHLHIYQFLFCWLGYLNM